MSDSLVERLLGHHRFGLLSFTEFPGNNQSSEMTWYLVGSTFLNLNQFKPIFPAGLRPVRFHARLRPSRTHEPPRATPPNPAGAVAQLPPGRARVQRVLSVR